VIMRARGFAGMLQLLVPEEEIEYGLTNKL
jgi:hypothetical protein